MREIHERFTNLKTQVITVTLKQKNELIINILKNSEKLLIYKKTVKKTIKQIIYVLINPALLFKTIIKIFIIYGYK